MESEKISFDLRVERKKCKYDVAPASSSRCTPAVPSPRRKCTASPCFVASDYTKHCAQTAQNYGKQYLEFIHVTAEKFEVWNLHSVVRIVSTCEADSNEHAEVHILEDNHSSQYCVLFLHMSRPAHFDCWKWRRAAGLQTSEKHTLVAVEDDLTFSYSPYGIEKNTSVLFTDVSFSVGSLSTMRISKKISEAEKQNSCWNLQW